MLLLALSLSLLAPQDVGARVDALCAASHGLATAHRIGTSRGGRPITLVEVAAPGEATAEPRPSVLIVAGVHGRHPLTTELALRHAERLVADYGTDERTTALLDGHRVLIVPQLDPDAAALDRIGNAASLDRDRDRRQGEDGPNDLDGDGVIAQMRWQDPAGTLVLAEDPRLLRPAKAEDGERGAWRLATEGKDDDGDGERDEDPADGVFLHRSFSHDWAPFDAETGMVPLGEPEARALADLVFARRDIALAIVYDVDDTLLGKPRTDKGRDRKPLTGILEDDLPLYEQAGKAYRDATGRSGAVADRHDDSVWSWLYCDCGIPTFACDVWRLPEPDKKDGTETADALRLARCEQLGRGFVPWHEVTHPELGKVEVGGFVQGTERTLLSDEERDTLLAQHHDWLLTVTSWLPACRIASFEAKPLADGFFRVKATVTNDGRMPARTAIGERCRRFPAPRLTLELGDAALVAGDVHQRADHLGGLGARAEFEWIVAAPKGTQLQLVLEHDFAGHDHEEVTL